MSTALEQSRVELPSLPGELTTVGYRPPEGLSYDEWVRAGRTLLGIGRAVQWWIGDWLRYGEHSYGEKYAQALEATGYDYQSLAQMVWVAGKVEFSRRRENLSWSHHVEVAPLAPGEQDAWLDAAEKKDWNSKELRQTLRTHKALPEPKFELVRFQLSPAALSALGDICKARNCTDDEAVTFALLSYAEGLSDG